ncbi:MAG: class I SAM-dependent RNA methyltransferase [Pseudomonadota bacterium]|nr:class I SAM-dependent RNA methyltransferase [Pseudomonadota bacterium]
MQNHDFFASCPRGLESYLATEITTLGGVNPKVMGGGVSFSGPWELLLRINLESRLASRVLWKITQEFYRNETDIYALAKNVRWCDYFDVRLSLMVKVEAHRCPLRSLEFVTLRIKDGICDRFRMDTGLRPNIMTTSPQVRVHAFLNENTATLYLDTSGQPLFQRQLKPYSGDAPLKENLAAGILAITGWNGKDCLYDPMCGSGTLLIEAIMLALNIPAGFKRGFAFERLHAFNASVWNQIRESRLSICYRNEAVNIFGSDLSGDAVELSRQNLKAAKLENYINLKQVNFIESKPPASLGIIVTNLPYGHRMNLTQALDTLYPKLGDTLKQKYNGWRAFLLTADYVNLIKGIRLSASKRTPLFNGPIECRLLEYSIVSGSNRKHGDS